MPSSPLLLAFVLTALGTTGCGTPSVDLHPRASKDMRPWKGTAALLDYEIQTGDSRILSDGCILTVEGVKPKKDYRIPLSTQSHSVLIDLPPGRYQSKSLACSSFTRWEVPLLLKGPLTLWKGKINYLGFIRFRFAPGPQDLAMERGDQGAVTMALSNDFSTMSPGWQEAVTDPFTRKRITKAMLVKKEDYHLNVQTRRFLKPGEEPASTSKLSETLAACDQENQKSAPYRAGTLDWKATYEGGKLTDFKTRGENAFSNDFLFCLSQALRQFKPSTPGKIEVTVSL